MVVVFRIWTEYWDIINNMQDKALRSNIFVRMLAIADQTAGPNRRKFFEGTLHYPGGLLTKKIRNLFFKNIFLKPKFVSSKFNFFSTGNAWHFGWYYIEEYRDIHGYNI